MKVCSKCGAEMPVGEFHPHRQARDGLRAACKPCTRKQNKAWADSNKERRRAYYKQWNAASRTKKLAVLLGAQGGLCAICRTPDPGPLKWHIDHDHATGTVRGALCGKCNLLLGFANDSLTTLAAAAAYLTGASK